MKEEVITKMVEKVGLYWHFVDLVWVLYLHSFILSLIYYDGNNTHKLEIF